jgi:hypothetical protein
MLLDLGGEDVHSDRRVREEGNTKERGSIEKEGEGEY